MDNLSLRLMKKPADNETEKKLIEDYLPDMIEICSNPIRAGIIHLLVKSPETGHSLKVEDLAYRMGTYHRIVLHHLERLKDWEVVEVRRMKSYGKKMRRSVWGLNLNYPNWIFEVYNSIKSGFSKEELKDISTKNKSMRNEIKKSRVNN